MVSHTPYSSEPTIGREDFSHDCLNLALARDNELILASWRLLSCCHDYKVIVNQIWGDHINSAVGVFDGSAHTTNYLFNKKHSITALIAGMIIYSFGGPGGRLNKKDGLTRYGNSHVKDKTS